MIVENEYGKFIIDSCKSFLSSKNATVYKKTKWRRERSWPKFRRYSFIGFGGLGVSVLAFDTLVRGFKPGRSRRIFKGEKILSTPSFGGEVKPSVPCRRFAACKRSLELRGSRILDEIYRNISRPRRVPPSAARCLSRRWTWRHLAEKVGTFKGRGKQWQPTPKNLPRMQCARAIPVTWLGSGSC